MPLQGCCPDPGQGESGSHSKLFVYGSLKRGFANHHYLAGQTFLGEAVSRPVYRLYAFGDYPAVIEASAGTGYSIAGELWEVDAACLRELDRLEDVDAGLYRRAPANLAGTDDPVILYLFAQDIADLPEVGPIWPPAS